MYSSPSIVKALTADKIADEFAAGLPRDAFVYFYKDGYVPSCRVVTVTAVGTLI